ncbi:MAG: ribonuclease III [Acidobacteria bacterium]|nr:ribonuclease III [Acidobacteriota bacterium]
MGTESSDFRLLEECLQYQFLNPDLLRRALTHKSYCYERLEEETGHYESLEFLGDAILGFVVSDLIFRHIPRSTEGQLSKIKAHLVSARNLIQFADKLQLGHFLRLSHGEEKTGGRTKKALLVDAFEAIIAAIYLDGGIEAARGFIERQFGSALRELGSQSFTSPDHKSSLQERLHQLGQPEPVYTVAHESGPDHRKHFIVQAMSGTDVLAQGEGRTKKEAQQNAAAAALKELDARPKHHWRAKNE